MVLFKLAAITAAFVANRFTPVGPARMLHRMIP